MSTSAKGLAIVFVCTKCNVEVDTSLTACPLCGVVITDFLRRYSQTPLDGKYRIESLLGVGGMGEVYKAMHVHLHVPRVIKLMRAKIAGQKEAKDRFMREARLATRIQHPNVAALFDFSELEDGSFYMVWEFIDGITLLDYVADRLFLQPPDAVRLAVQALAGLDAIHRAGIIHRDISPENLMITRDDQGRERVKLIDLGVAKQWDAEGETQTRTGIFVGKFKYCSPEQLGMLKPGERIDGRADIYSFGLVLYEMLTGVPPFQAETPHEYVLMHAAKMPQPLKMTNPRVSVPPQLESIIFRAVSKERERRFDSALDFARALETALPSMSETVTDTPTLVLPLSLPAAQSVADSEIPTPAAAQATVVSAAKPAPPPRPAESTGSRRTGIADTAGGRKRDLFEQVVAAMGEEQFAKADVAAQTLRMHLGARAETDTEFRRLRKELEAAAADKDAAYVAAIETAKQRAEPKEMQRLILEREERLGKRFGDPSLKFEIEVWLRTRSELLAKIRNFIAADSFNNAGHLLSELAVHLEGGAASDEEHRALKKAYEQAFAEASEKMRGEISGAHRLENIVKTRRLLSTYEAKFGKQTRKHADIAAAESWLQEMDRLRGAADAKPRAAESHNRRRIGWGVISLSLFLIVSGGVALAVYYRRPETAALVRQYTTGPTQAALLDALGVKPPTAPASRKTPPLLDATHRTVEGQTWRNPIDGLEYVWIPDGTVDAGCAAGDRLCSPEEKPRRGVAVAGFWLGRSEVTVEAFGRFVRTTGYHMATRGSSPTIDASVTARADARWTHPLAANEPARPSWPVAWLTMNDAAAYCAWAGGRLPQSVEWEYAARGRSAPTVHSWGNTALPPSRIANLADEGMMKAFAVTPSQRRELFGDYFDGFDTYAPAGSFPPNSFRLENMEGNVWEWCTDGNASVLRGGSWASSARDVRISARMRIPPDAATFATGCRCALPAK